jgi:D-proline reductase (dithiol) PrdB
MLRRAPTATKPVRGFPFTRFVGDLDRKRIMLVSTAGIAPRLHQFEEPEKGYYRLDRDVRIEDLHLPNRHFNLEDVDEDLNCLFPIDALRRLVQEGVVGHTTDYHLSIYGFHLVLHQIRRSVAPLIAEEVEAADADGVVVLAGCLFCHRIAAVVQRAIEDRGIPAVGISQYPRLSLFYGVSRVLYPVGFRPGHAVGLPGHPEMHRTVLRDALELLVSATQPLTLVRKEYEGYPMIEPKWKRWWKEEKLITAEE